MENKRQQSKRAIDEFYKGRNDPWGYFSNDDDSSRREILVAELAALRPVRALDIGCGNGFVTEKIPAQEVVALDISGSAIHEARARAVSPHIKYEEASLFDLGRCSFGKFDLVLVTGVLYGQYIGSSLPLVYQLVDEVLLEGGALVSVHIDGWYFARFPYPLVRSRRYSYREYTHLLEVYRK